MLTSLNLARELTQQHARIYTTSQSTQEPLRGKSSAILLS